MEEQRRQQEYVQRASYATDNRSADLNEEASRYYNDDWSNNDSTYAREKPRRRRPIPGEFVLSIETQGSIIT